MKKFKFIFAIMLLFQSNVFASGKPVYQEDEYRVTLDMIKSSHVFKYSFMPFHSVIFKNNTTNEVLFMELGVNYRKGKESHFYYKNGLPDELIDSYNTLFKLNNVTNSSDCLAMIETEIQKAKNIDEKYFKTKKGLHLASTKEEAISIYGKPNSIIEKNGIELLSWNEWRDGREETDPQKRLELLKKGKIGFGFGLEIYFRDEKAYFIYMWHPVP